MVLFSPAASELLLLVAAIVSGTLGAEQTCKPLTHPECKLAGYSFTAPFPDINGKPYQEVKGRELKPYLDSLKSCSKYSAAIMCSLYFPKCVPKTPRPLLPCRSVCNDFVHTCGKELNIVAMNGMFAAACELLPVYDGKEDTCFLPEGFNMSKAAKGVDKNVCHRVGIAQCTDDLHYNTTFISNNTQSASSFHILQTVIASKCSPNMEKFTCYTRFPPCNINQTSPVYVPCKELCFGINKLCGKVFRDNGLPMTDCDIFYPEGSTPTGLCPMSKWPAPWSQGVLPTETPKVPACSKCAPVTIPVCEHAGYKDTFHFHDIDGKPYQQANTQALTRFIPLLKCSKLAQAILCSMYVPKCDRKTCTTKPVLPCRSVCHQFVLECEVSLRVAAVQGLFIGLCDLLPRKNTPDTPCFAPPGFRPTNPAYSRDVCFPISNTHNKCTKDLSYNLTFLSSSDQVKAKLHVLEQVIQSKCSANIEKFFCYTRIPPCSPKPSQSVPLPCRSMCKRVITDCAQEFKRLLIPVPDCDFILPDSDGVDGICVTSTFPVPLRHIRHETPTTGPKPGLSGGSIALIVIFVILSVVVIAIIAVIFIRWRRNAQPFEPKELHNVEATET